MDLRPSTARCAVIVVSATYCRREFGHSFVEYTPVQEFGDNG